MIHRPTNDEILIQMRRTLADRIARHAPLLNAPAWQEPTDPKRRQRSRQTCHRFSLYERPRSAPPKDTGAYVPEMSARLEDDPNLTDGARRCMRKVTEYTYRHNREGRAADITVTYLMRALGRCRRTVQRYLRLLEREGYISVDVVYGANSRMCTGLIVQLLAPLFPRHRNESWPVSAAIPEATPESQNNRFKYSGSRRLHRMPVREWALRCMDGVYRSLMKTIPPLPAGWPLTA